MARNVVFLNGVTATAPRGETMGEKRWSASTRTPPFRSRKVVGLHVETDRAIHFVAGRIIEVDIDRAVSVRDTAAVRRGNEVYLELPQANAQHPGGRLREIRVVHGAAPNAGPRAVAAKANQVS